MELAIIKKMVEAQIPPGKLNLDETHLVDAEGKKAYKFVCAFYAEHGSLPSIQTVEKECDVKLGYIDASEPLDYYLGQLKKRNKSNKIARFIQWAIKSLEKEDDPDKVMDIMRGVIKETDKDDFGKIWSIEESFKRRITLLIMRLELRWNTTGLLLIWR